jgi:hypothetical protein
VRRHAGEAAFIQRCQVHKKRNVVDHLPDEHKADVKRKLQNAYAMADYADAKRAPSDCSSRHSRAEELTPFLQTDQTLSQLYGPVPVAFVKLQAGKNTSFEIGSLPIFIGAEYTFSFENMNIERGLLWNQENAVNRGIQVNQTMGKFSASKAVSRIQPMPAP